MRFTSITTFLLLLFVGVNQVIAIEPVDTVLHDSTKFSIGNMVSIKSPMVEVSGGNTSFAYNNNTQFQSDLALGVVLGFYSDKKVFRSEVRNTSQNGLYLTYVKSSDSADAKASVNSWRFGIQNSDIYTLPLNSTGSVGVEFATTQAPLSWFSQSFPALGADSATAAQLQGRFDGVRFGESSKASIGLRVANPVSISAGFEWSQAYERHLVWYWAMSSIIENVADGVGAYFVSAVGKSSPLASPIIHFIVRNGIAMGFKALRKNQMNWPFSTAAPLNYYNYSISVSIRL